MLKLVVLISGGGSNLRALLEASEDALVAARGVAIGNPGVVSIIVPA